MHPKGYSKDEIVNAWNYWYPLVYGYFYRRLNNREDVEDATANTLNALFTATNVTNPKGFVWQTAKYQLYKFIDNKTKTPNFISLNEPENEHLGGENGDNNVFNVNLYNQDSDWQNNQTVTENTISYPENDGDDEYSAHYQSKIQVLIKCFKTYLKDEDYQIVYASIVEEKNSTKIGAELNLKPATVRQKIKRGIDKLKESCVELWTDLKLNNSE